MAAASSEAADTDDIMPLPPPFRGEHKAIILWDLDETLIALRSQLKNREAVQTVAMMEKLLEDYLDDVFHFHVVEEFDPENVCDHLSPEQLANEQQRGANVQTQAAEELAKDLVKYLEYAVAAYATDSVSTSAPSVVWWQNWQKHLDNLDTFCNQWTAQAQKILAFLKDKGCLHMAVTNTRLVAALAKLKLWGLSSFFEPQWIYSSSHRGKQAVFCRALQAAANAGIGSEIVLAVGDGPEEEAASRTYQLPFIKIFNADDLERVVHMVESKLSPPLQSQAQAQADVLAVVNEIDKAQCDKPHTQAKHGGATNEGDSRNTEDAPDLHNVQSNKRLRRGSFEMR